MCAARRAGSTRVTRLAAKASPYYHTAVTLYAEPKEEGDARPGPSTTRTRRTRRGRRDESVDVVGDVGQRRSRVKSEPEPGQDGLGAVDGDGDAKSPPKKAKSKSTPVASSLAVPHPTPAKWSDAYAAIKAMRAQTVAPVDTMGCQHAQRGEREPKNQRFATLVSLMLSSQTKDEVTDAAMSKLRTALGGSVSLQAMLDAEDSVISEAIAKVGFWRRKTLYIKQTAQRLHDDFDGDVPKTIDELCSLPGVGPKMAFLTLQVAWRLNVGIGVDVHVHRITNRLGWHIKPTKNPEETRVNLESWLPKELHGEINHLLVGFGQTVCLPVGPKCGECTLSAADLCPSAQTAKSKGRSKTAKKKGSGPRIEIEIEPPMESFVKEED